jgi:hypothetical protein
MASAVTASGGWAALMLVLGLPAALAGAAPAGFSGVDIPPYPGAELTPVGEQSRYNGSDLRMYAFETDAAPQAVLEHYHKLWSAQGQIVSVHRGVDGSLGVGYVELQDGGTRTVSLVQRGSRTVGFAAVLRGIPVPYTANARAAGDVPVHPRGLGLSSYESLEAGGSFQTVNYSVAQGREVMERFFLKEMGQRGYQLLGRTTLPGDSGSVMLEFGRGARRMSVTLAWLPRVQMCSVFVVSNTSRAEPAEETP